MWMKLSQTLPHTKSPDTCQSCGVIGNPDHHELQRWQECDNSDRPTKVVVVLCAACAKRLIEPHPRLYRQLSYNEPFPGSHGVCLGCSHRDGTSCAHPDAKANGGTGVMMTVGQPTRIHVQRSPRSRSGWVNVWPYPPKDCEQRNPPKA